MQINLRQQLRLGRRIIKAYLIGFGLMFFVFLATWLPTAEIIFSTESEPLISDFEFNLDAQIDNSLYNLKTLKAEFITTEEVNDNYYSLKELVDQSNNRILVFSKQDLFQAIQIEIQRILPSHKKVIELHPAKWEIQVTEKRFLEGKARIKAFIQEKTSFQYDLSDWKQEVVLTEESVIKSQLENLPGVKSVEIKTRLCLRHRLPLFSQRIKFTVKPQ